MELIHFTNTFQEFWTFLVSITFKKLYYLCCIIGRVLIIQVKSSFICVHQIFMEHHGQFLLDIQPVFTYFFLW